MVTELMKNSLVRKDTDVLIVGVDLSAGGSAFSSFKRRILRNVYALFKLVKLMFELMWFGNRAKVYFAISGGSGQWIEIPIIIFLSRLVDSVYIHHHSYLYLNNKRKLLNLLAYVDNCNHIFLSPGMASQYLSMYSISDNSGTVRALSNTVWMSDVDLATVSGLGATNIDEIINLKIGFLSNLSLEKGLLEFLEISRAFGKNNGSVSIEYYLAGTIVDEICASLITDSVAAQEINYVGPLYGKQKDHFYQDIDVFLFPTKYKNEAEPLVIHEALSAGCIVLANDLGAISDLSRFGEVRLQQGVEQYVSALNSIIGEDLLPISKDERRIEYERMQTLERAELVNLTNEMLRFEI
jgi:glycosyltransferase involved in cell wall biosynthesis